MANQLVKQAGVPTQAALRRAVSTAYYAVFHLLSEEAGRRWDGTAAARTGMERAMTHASMKNTCLRFDVRYWTDWHNALHPVPDALRRLARAFVYLQDQRHAADYNNHPDWSVTDAEDILRAADLAFSDWRSVREEPIAGDYLLSMVVGKQR